MAGVARIRPATAHRAHRAHRFELDRLLADAIPHLGMDEAACFDADIQAVRAQLDGSERSWDFDTNVLIQAERCAGQFRLAITGAHGGLYLEGDYRWNCWSASIAPIPPSGG